MNHAGTMHDMLYFLKANRLSLHLSNTYKYKDVALSLTCVTHSVQYSHATSTRTVHNHTR